MRVVSLFDFSTYALKPWYEAGHECIAVDTLHGDPAAVKFEPSKLWCSTRFSWDLSETVSCHYVADLRPDLILAFPPCTDLAVSGAKHFAKKSQADPDFQLRAIHLCRLAERLGDQLGCPWMVENPVGCISTMWRKPDWVFHPWQYSGLIPFAEAKHPDWPEYVPEYDWYPKRTGIWCGNGFHMPDACELRRMLNGKKLSFQEWQRDDWEERRYSPQFKKLGGKSLKTKLIRSLTPRGYAAAVHAVNDPNYGEA